MDYSAVGLPQSKGSVVEVEEQEQEQEQKITAILLSGLRNMRGFTERVKSLHAINYWEKQLYVEEFLAVHKQHKQWELITSVAFMLSFKVIRPMAACPYHSNVPPFCIRRTPYPVNVWR